MTKWKCQDCGQEFYQPLAVRRCVIGHDGKEHWDEGGYTCLCPDCQSSNISEMHICDKCQAESDKLFEGRSTRECFKRHLKELLQNTSEGDE